MTDEHCGISHDALLDSPIDVCPGCGALTVPRDEHGCPEGLSVRYVPELVTRELEGGGSP